MARFEIASERLILRDWQPEDLEPFHAMCSDPRIMDTLGPLMSRQETSALINRMRTGHMQNGHTMWAMERKADGRFIGWCGIIRGSVGPIVDKPEIGWRIAHDVWGQGYAREAALASLKWGFANLTDDAIWAITTPVNTRSWGLMERLGMSRHTDLDFTHPKVADDSHLKVHITYSMERTAWTASASSH